MKAIKLILKVSGIVLLLFSAVFLVYSYYDEIVAKLPKFKRPAEYDDYADVNPE